MALFAVFAMYLFMAMPVCGHYCASFGGIKSTAVIGVSVAGVHFDRYVPFALRGEGGLLSVLDMLAAEEKNLSPFMKRTRKCFFAAIRKAVRIERIDAQLRVGLDEAWSTAIAAGGARAALFSAVSVFSEPHHVSVHVIPDFASPCFFMRLRCIFSVTVGDIMLKAALAVMKRNEKGRRNAAASHSKPDEHVHGKHP